MIIKGEEVEFLSAGTVMGAEMIDPMAQHMVECNKCGGLKYPSAFTPSQLNLSHPQCRACRAETEKKRKVGGVKCDVPLGAWRAWENPFHKPTPEGVTVVIVAGCQHCNAPLDKSGSSLCPTCKDYRAQKAPTIYKRLKESGKCVICRKDALTGKTRCMDCTIRRREIDRRLRKRKAK